MKHCRWESVPLSCWWKNFAAGDNRY